MFHIPPEAVVTVSAFRDETVDMWIPFQVSTKRVQDHNKSGSEVAGLIHFKKHAGDNTGNGMEQAVKQGAVFQKEIAKSFINGEDAVAVRDIDQLKGHRGSAIHGIFVTTGRAEAAVTAERNKFKLTAMRAGIHGTAKRWVTTVDHLINIFHLSFSGVKSIFNFFIIVCKNFLKDIHKTIMHEKEAKRNP